MENRSPPLYKRIIPLVCTFAVLISMIAFPAMADEVNAYTYNLLDYSFPNDSDRYAVTITDGSVVNFKMPIPSVIAYVDILFYNTGQIANSVTLSHGSASANLTIKQVSGRLYRAYGSITVSTDDDLNLTFGVNGTGYITFYRFDIATQAISKAELEVSASIVDYATTPATSYTLDYTGTPVSSSWSGTQAAADNRSYRADLLIYDYQAYDYVDLMISTVSNGVTSINCTLGGVSGNSVPYTVTYLDSGDAYQTGLVTMAVRIDLTNVQRTVDTLFVIVTADESANGYNSFAIQSCTGITQLNEVSPWLVWFNNLKGWLDSGFASVVSALGGNADTSEMETEVGAIKDQMKDASDTMADFTRPPVEEVFTEVELEIGTGTPFADMMAAFFDNDFVVSIITGSLAFTLFGILVG